MEPVLIPMSTVTISLDEYKELLMNSLELEYSRRIAELTEELKRTKERCDKEIGEERECKMYWYKMYNAAKSELDELKEFYGVSEEKEET